MDDSTYVDAIAAQDGKPESFARLYERVAPAVAAWASVRTSGAVRQLVDPDDLSQEIWWRALEGFPRFEPERGSFRSWLFGIAANTFRSLIRQAPLNRGAQATPESRQVDLPSELQAQLTSITKDARRRDRVAELVDLVNAMPDDERRLFVHCGLEGAKLLDTATLLGISENAAKKRWQKLRRQLEDHPLFKEFIEAS